MNKEMKSSISIKHIEEKEQRIQKKVQLGTKKKKTRAIWIDKDLMDRN